MSNETSIRTASGVRGVYWFARQERWRAMYWDSQARRLRFAGSGKTVKEAAEKLRQARERMATEGDANA